MSKKDGNANANSTTRVSINTAKDLIPGILQAGLVPMIHGSPAIGKSAIVAEIAKDFKLKLIDLRMSQMEPTDMKGLPFFKDGKATYMPFDVFPLEDTPIPEGYNGWMIFFDEANAAPTSVQAAAYQVTLDRMVGEHRLHKNVAIVLAGNLETDGAIVTPLSTAMQSRLVHLEVFADAQEFITWAESKGNFDYRITSYLSMVPEHVYNFSADHTDKTYGSPRTWAFVNRYLKVIPKLTVEHVPVLCGMVGEGIARQFYGFCQLEDNMPKIKEIEANPQGVPIPNNPSLQWAFTGMAANYITEANADALVDYALRLPAEFKVITARKIVSKHKQFDKHPAIKRLREACSKILL